MKMPYPRATENRLVFSAPEMKQVRKQFWPAAMKNFIILQLVFLIAFSWVFGSLYQQSSHVHNLNVVFVDYDGGAIGQAVRVAYHKLAAQSFPTLLEQPPSAFPTPQDLRAAVCRTQYWAALYTVAGASDELQATLHGAPLASHYDPNNAVYYIWNEALYPVAVDAAIAGNLQTLSNTARIAYSSTDGTGNVTIPSLSGAAALSVLADPWTLTSINIQATTQGSRAIYNTIVFILIMTQEFYYLDVINGLYARFKMTLRAKPSTIVLMRNLNSLTYTLAGSLCTTGAIWAFRSSWDVGGGQFMLSWMVLWLFAHVNFLTLDCFVFWVPAPFVPIALISWIIVNVTSVLLPFELSPGWYNIGYILPAHELYQVLVDIWSRGCNPQLRYAIPVLFAWEILSFLLAALGIYRRAHHATLENEMQQRQFQERLDAAVCFQMKRDQEERQKLAQEEIVRDQIARD